MFSLNQTAPSWDEPIEMLFACHGKVKKFCGQLRQLPDYLDKNGVNTIAKEAIVQIKTYFDKAAPLHHEDEEQDFFPTLLQYAPQAQSDVDELERQHIILHQSWTNMRMQLDELLSDQRTQLDDEVLNTFLQGYDRHIAIEEPLFDLGREVIPETERRAIGKIMAARRIA